MVTLSFPRRNINTLHLDLLAIGRVSRSPFYKSYARVDEGKKIIAILPPCHAQGPGGNGEDRPDVSPGDKQAAPCMT